MESIGIRTKKVDMERRTYIARNLKQGIGFLDPSHLKMTNKGLTVMPM